MAGRQVRAIGIPWFRRADYDGLRRLFADGAGLPATFDQWHERAEELRRQIEAQGGIAERVMIDPDEFPAWCRGRGLDIDSEARKRFAAAAVARKYGRTS